MGASASGELYGEPLIGMLQIVRGEGWRSPDGPDEVMRLLAGADLAGRSVLDVGCGASFVTGIDVEDTVLAHARSRIAKAGFDAGIGVAKVAPGPLPFPPQCFEVVFSTDSIVHIPDKHALMREVFRC